MYRTEDYVVSYGMSIKLHISFSVFLIKERQGKIFVFELMCPEMSYTNIGLEKILFEQMDEKYSGNRPMAADNMFS